MANDVLDVALERYEYTKTAWHDIRAEAAIDMQYVAGDPWDADDKTQRKGRPTIAPEEMGQYFNQVINQLWANPRGMKFAPRGNGASEAGARFYQNKAREIEYRSHAKVAYITAAADAIQRSYGFVRVNARYASPRSANQELWIEAMPDPDMVSMDPDAKSPDSSDATYAFVEEWRDQGEFERQYPKAKVRNFGDWATRLPSWLQGKRVKVAEYWTVSTTPRQLVLVQMPAAPISAQPQRMVAPPQTPEPEQREVFDDEIPEGAIVVRELRMVDYPQVKMYLTNGLEILHEQDWPGKYIPIVSCYGKVLYIPTGGETKRTLLSMTRFGRAPWKAMCYAASQQLELLSMIPKAPLMAAKGQFAGALGLAVQESMYQPKAWLEYDPMPPGNATGQPLPPPQRVDYPAGQHLQSVEMVKEGFRRQIQAAMGSNFLPTEAQKRGQKSGVALDKIEQSATTGTFHFINNYEDMIRQVGVICEDLIDKYYDFAGETSVMEPDESAKSVWINSPGKQDAIDTTGDYLVTVSTGPSSDSEREAVQEFTESLVTNIERIAAISGPKAAAAVFAKAIRLRNGGPEMDALADIVEPPEYKSKDGQKPPDPQMLALQGENQQLKGMLQQAEQEKQAKQIEQQGKLQIAQMQEQGEYQRNRENNETKLAVAELGAKVERLMLFLEERARLGTQQHDVAQAAADAQNEARLADMAHRQAIESAEMAHTQAIEQGSMQPDTGGMQ